MTPTAIDELVGKILTEADKYNDDGDVIGIELWNAYRSCVDLSEFVQQANEVFKEQIQAAYQQGYNNAYFSKAINKEEYYNQVYENTEKEQFYETTFTMKLSNLSLEETRKMYEKLWNSGESIVVYLDKDGILKPFKNKNK
jgi:uncharacterized protein YuzE